MPRPMLPLALLFVTQLASCRGAEPKPESGPGQLALGAPAPVHTAEPKDSTKAAAQAAPPALSSQHPPMRSEPSSGLPRDITPSGKVAPQAVAGFTFDVPSEWQSQKPKSSMRLAEFTMPGPGGDAELSLFRFPGGAGSIEANLTRWKGQFSPPAGKTLEDVSVVTKFESAGFKLTLLDLTGTYSGGMAPASVGVPPQADQRMLAAIAEGSGDPLFFKCVGPAQTMKLWAKAYEGMLRSLRVKQ